MPRPKDASSPAPSAQPRTVNLRQDLAASWVVFLVALPLSLGVALASGAPLMAGIIAAAVGGIVAGALGGAPLTVSGPAAGMTVVVFANIERFGVAGTCAITAAAGLIQLALGSARVARLATAIAPAVLRGMLAGIGVLIVAAQVQVALGAAPASSLWANLTALPANLLQARWEPAAIAAFTFALLLLGPRLPTSRLGIPAAVVAIVAASALARALQLDLARVQLPDRLALPEFELGQHSLMALGIAALGMALVASAESLLSAVAVDALHNGKRANLDRELMGQGVANLLSGLFGRLAGDGGHRAQHRQHRGRCPHPAVHHAARALDRAGGAVAAPHPAGDPPGLPGRPAGAGGHQTAAAPADARPGGQWRGFGLGRHLLRGGGHQPVGRHRAGPRHVGPAAVFLRLTRAEIAVCEPAPGRWQVTLTGAATFILVPRLLQTLDALPAGQQVQLNIHSALLDHAAGATLSTWRASYERQGGQVSMHQRGAASASAVPPLANAVSA